MGRAELGCSVCCVPELSLPTVMNGDSLELLRDLPDNSIDAVVTDPPYGLTDLPVSKVTQTIGKWIGGQRDFIPVSGKGFMSARWDRFVPPPALWDEVFRVLKPGGHIAVFSGARTVDLMTISMRLAGFEIRDLIAWVYASGMPKGQNLGNVNPDQDGWYTHLKPALEPITLARKPIDQRTVTANIAEHGTGALHIDAARVPHRSEADRAESENKNKNKDYGTEQGQNNVYGDYSNIAQRGNYSADKGRFAPNLLLDSAAGDVVDEQSGITRSVKGKPRTASKSGDGWGSKHGGTEYNDIGGASRFFPIADTDPLTDIFPVRFQSKAHSSERPVVDGIRHTTVKPLALMRWILPLLTPLGGTVLDPFTGSGTTLEAAMLEGFRSIGFERDGQFIPLIDFRVARAAAVIAEHREKESA